MNEKEMSKTELFLELAKPDKNGKSRWVNTTEFVGKYKELQLGNGFSWGRTNSPLAKRYVVLTRCDLTAGNRIDAVKLDGYNTEKAFNQTIRRDIREEILRRRCVMLGVNGKSENTLIEVDHKDGRKNDERVSDMSTQNINDFQPLCKAANDIKRQICKNCKETNERWDAKNISGNPYSFYKGDEHYDDEIGCVGCYQYDPVEYRKVSIRRISEEAARHTSDYIMNKLFPKDKDKEDE